MIFKIAIEHLFRHAGLQEVPFPSAGPAALAALLLQAPPLSLRGFDRFLRHPQPCMTTQPLTVILFPTKERPLNSATDLET